MVGINKNKFSYCRESAHLTSFYRSMQTVMHFDMPNRLGVDHECDTNRQRYKQTDGRTDGQTD